MIVLWRITERCNYACGFCAYDRRLRIPRREATVAEALRLGAMLGQWARATGERVLVSWLGGEPLLWPPLFEVSRALCAEGLAVSLTTNGSLLHRPEVRERLLDHLDEVTVSVDAMEAQHDALRGFDGAWARCRDGIVALREARDARGAGTKLRANVVLMRATLPQFDQLCATLSEWGIDEITFNQLGGRDRPEFFAAERLRSDDIALLRARLGPLQVALAAQGVRLCAAPRYLDRLAATAADEALPIDDCGMGEQRLFIDEQGRIAPCSFSVAEFGLPISGVTSADDFSDLPDRFRAIREVARCPACADCPSTQVFAKFDA
jgi:MoaA/NifB/PqqE/SkfB family radical SAM enzyme